MVDNLPVPKWYLSAAMAFFFRVLSLGVNTRVTDLIVYKIMTVWYHDIREFNISNVQASTREMDNVIFTSHIDIDTIRPDNNLSGN